MVNQHRFDNVVDCDGEKIFLVTIQSFCSVLCCLFGVDDAHNYQYKTGPQLDDNQTRYPDVFGYHMYVVGKGDGDEVSC